MVHQSASSRRQRLAVLGSVLALHAIILALFLQRARPAAVPIRPASIAMIDIAAERPAAAKPPPPTLPAKLAKTFKPITEISIPAEIESDAPAGASTACSTLAVVLGGILQDPVAVAALRSAPPDTRSISQAVMMWNEAWIPAANDATSPLWSVRENIERTLAGVSDGCLDEPLIGPRLLPIPDADAGSTSFVVFGSGNWTWRKMITPAETLATERAVLDKELPAPAN